MNQYVPQAYTTTNGQKCTAKYVHIQTDTIYRAVENLGFMPIESSTSKRAKEHSRHVTIFQKDDMLFDGCHPRLIVDNSHDGSKAMYIRFGLYRTYCANGLVIGTDLVSPLRIVHKGKVDQIERKIVEFVAEAQQKTIEMYQKLSQIELDLTKAAEFAEKAFKLRHGDAEGNPNFVHFVTTRGYRRQDFGSSLWLLYNRTQEVLMQGAAKRSRKITSARKAVDFNVELNNLVMQYAA